MAASSSTPRADPRKPGRPISHNHRSEKNYGTSVELASYSTDRCIAHVIASPQHCSRAAPISRRNQPRRDVRRPCNKAELWRDT
ncbi:hypothetical protein EVAR_95828_1 [Eumeta japonica]|uniref:Uncharacterized protein n=1 Tax=Eumeta variegata TaxID=151549 RepID=A0A4C1VM18_EUMVA|nr:hypothetical protein EVAR_95828_1 [Eumeta japonica]